MNILYQQDTFGSLSRFGVKDCYFKELALDRERGNIIKKSHAHTGFEMHIVTDGRQQYEVADATYTLTAGTFLLIYPNVAHTARSAEPCTRKYSITFTKSVDETLPCFFGSITARMADTIAFLVREAMWDKEISSTLIENSILELLVSAFRMTGAKEKPTTLTRDNNAIVAMAKQYIEDNIQTAPGVAAVAEYCHLSSKQLTRVFHRFESVTPGEYILGRRVAKIEQLLTDPTLTLKQISETMSFDNEYYFNAFFKKHAGMPPGAYRKMLGQ